MKRSLTSFALFSFFLIGPRVCVGAESELKRDASWDYPTAGEIKAELDVWVAERELDAGIADQIAELWRDAEYESVESAAPTHGSVSQVLRTRDLTKRLFDTIRLVEPESNALIDACHTVQVDAGRFPLPRSLLLEDETTPAVVRDNLRLLVGEWLADHRLYDEALSQLDLVEIGNVVDPAKLLFYQAACHYRLRHRDEGLAAMEKLLERSGGIPERYDTVAQLMQSDLKALKADSLDEVAKIMDSITDRLGHGRAGQRVRKEEDDVIDKLDKMIEELEKQRQQQQQQGQSGKGGKQSTRPMQDSVPAGGSGPGNIDPKKLAEDIDWGDLPPKEREEALQRLGDEFPSHYREVIEEYFRKLARKEGEGP
jgi:hypothetical protein